MYHEYSRQVGPNAILLFDTEVVLNLEIMTSSIYKYNIRESLLEYSPQVLLIEDSSPDRVKPHTMKLVFVASPKSV